MRRVLLTSLVLSLLLVPAVRVRAADDIEALIDNAIRAHGGAAKLDQVKAVETKAKGTLDLAGGISFTQEVSLQMPDKLKSVMNLQVGGQKITVTSVYDGKKLWVNANGNTMELDDKIVGEVKEQLYAGTVGRLTPLKDKKKYELSPLGEVKIDGRDAVGVKVVSKGHKDINLFFEKKTNLLIKEERQAVDAMTGMEYTQETILSNYKAVDGYQLPYKTVVYRDGKKFLEAEMTEFKLVDGFDDSMFAKP